MKFIARENSDSYFQAVPSEVPFGKCGGSLNVLAARLLDLSYPDYLQYCRANFNGLLRGRTGYSYCVYKDKKDCEKLCEILNKEWVNVEKFLKENIK